MAAFELLYKDYNKFNIDCHDTFRYISMKKIAAILLIIITSTAFVRGRNAVPFKNVTLIDGGGQPLERTDILVRGDTIAVTRIYFNLLSDVQMVSGLPRQCQITQYIYN